MHEVVNIRLPLWVVERLAKDPENQDGFTAAILRDACREMLEIINES